MENYKQALKEYKDKKENLRLEGVVQKVEWKKNVYKDLFLVTLSSFLIYFLWNKYSL